MKSRVPCFSFALCLVGLILAGTVFAADPPGASGDTTLRDHLAVVSRAPGLPEGSIFAGFENNENVSILNGNLNISHPSSPSLPFDAGGSIALNRVYNSKNVAIEKVKQTVCDPDTALDYSFYLTGESWIGAGWTMHLGRMFDKSRGHCSPTCGQPAYATYGSELYFEDAQGTEYRLTPDATHAKPVLRWEYIDDQFSSCPDCPDCPEYCYDPEVPTPNHCYRDCGEFCDPCVPQLEDQAHYQLVFPDGTIYRFEFIREHSQEANTGYITNHDVAGWYATEITDVNGNKLDVVYYKDENPTHPEAIKEIRYTQSGATTHRLLISTVLWQAGEQDINEDGAPFTIDSSVVGKLKIVRAKGFNTLDVEYAFHYEVIDNTDVIGSPVVLRRVDLPEQGTVEYGYDLIPLPSDPPIPPGGASAPLVGRVVYPTGGASVYAWEEYFAGEYPRCRRACASHPPPVPNDCNINWCINYQTQARREIGVSRRTIYPDGLGGGTPPDGLGMPKATWLWEREWRLPSVGPAEPPPEAVNSFMMIEPDGRRTEYEQLGNVKGRTGWEGNVKSKTVWAADGTKMMREDYSYHHDGVGGVACSEAQERIAVQLQETIATNYLEESGCSTLEDSVTGARVTTTEHFDLSQPWRDFRITSVSGDYLRAPRVTYTGFFDSVEAPECDLGEKIIGLYGDFFVEQDGLRYERTRTWTCDGNLKKLVAKNERRGADTDLSDPVNPVVSDNQDEDLDDLISESEYDADDLTGQGTGNLIKITYSGGDDYPDGTPANNYEARFPIGDYEFGQATNMELGPPGTFSYKAQDVDVDSAGFVTASREANLLESRFEFDKLGRLTKIDPPGTFEYPNRVAYPSLNDTKIAQSDESLSIDHAPNEEDQIYSYQVYDKLGRLAESWKAMPDGLSVRVYRYDEMGREVFRSEWMTETEYNTAMAAATPWEVARDIDGDGADDVDYFVDVPVHPSGVPWGTTTFYGTPAPSPNDGNPLMAMPDRLGKARQVKRADGSTTDTQYCGPHREVVVEIETATGPLPSVTRYYNDALGRLILVETPSEGADAVYSYDPLGNLTEVRLVADLPADPFSKWLGNAINPNPSDQVRTFDYDGVGRLRFSSQPENGVTTYDAYDVWGKLLSSTDAMGGEEGHVFRNTYDLAGRLLSADKTDLDIDRLGGAGGFDQGGWETGHVVNDIFVENLVDPKWQILNQTACPLGTESVLSYGNCDYALAPNQPEVARTVVNGVAEDDHLSFRFWRHVRYNPSGSLDALMVWAVLGQTNDVSAKKVVFRADESAKSMATWRRAAPIKPSEFFDDTAWPTGTQQDVTLYVVFDKGDGAAPGLSGGVAVDEFFVGSVATEALASYEYDVDACAYADIHQPTLCDGVQEPTNHYKGKLSRMKSYQGGRLVAQKTLAYMGLNGRLSGEAHQIDWTQAEDSIFNFHAWYSNYGYQAHGLLSEREAPRQVTLGPERTYRYDYARGLLWDVSEVNGGEAFSFLSWPKTKYNAAGTIKKIRYRNETETETVPDVLYRPDIIVARGPVTNLLWVSGTYRYDNAGNIASIGYAPEIQEYDYDLVGRLTDAHVREQAQGGQDVYDLSYSYDIFGNMTARTWDDGSQSPPPPGLVLDHNHSENRILQDLITGAQFSYDANGNTTDFMGPAGTSEGARWDERNRMTDFTRAGGVVESYVYDAEGYRLARVGAGNPMVSIRDGSGQLLSEFEWNPTTSTFALHKDFLYGGGKLLLEREPVTVLPEIQASVPLTMGGLYVFQVTEGLGASDFTVDIRADSGHLNQLSVTPVGGSMLMVDESEFSMDEVNYIRIKPNGVEPASYSQAVTLAIDSTVTSASKNQVRAVSVSRIDDDVQVSFDFLESNGNKSYVYFKRADTGQLVLQTLNGLSPGVTFVTIPDQSLVTLCGEMVTEQIGEYSIGSALDFEYQPDTGSTCDSPQPDPILTFVDSYHHRDHLGNLRIVTDGAGMAVSRHDFYPFGKEIAMAGEPTDGGSRKRFTGHERDQLSQLDYMLARYCSSALARFTGPDPSAASIDRRIPQSWNRYQYVLNRPTSYIDPDGRIPWYTLKAQHPSLAQRMESAMPRVTTALRSALDDPEYNPKFKNTLAYEYWPKSSDYFPKGEQLIPLGNTWANRQIGSTSRRPFVPLGRRFGDRQFVGIDGSISDGVLSGTMFVAGYNRAKPTLSGVREGMKALVAHASVLKIGRAAMTTVLRRFGDLADQMSSTEEAAEWRGFTEDLIKQAAEDAEGEKRHYKCAGEGCTDK